MVRSGRSQSGKEAGTVENTDLCLLLSMAGQEDKTGLDVVVENLLCMRNFVSDPDVKSWTDNNHCYLLETVESLQDMHWVDKRKNLDQLAESAAMCLVLGIVTSWVVMAVAVQTMVSADRTMNVIFPCVLVENMDTQHPHRTQAAGSY